MAPILIYNKRFVSCNSNTTHIWKRNADLGKAWTPTTCMGSLYYTIVLQESSEKTTSFGGLLRQWYDFAQEKHRWRQFLFTTNVLFPVTATKHLIEKKILTWARLEPWYNSQQVSTLPLCYTSLPRKLPVFGVFEGNNIILLRKSIDGANFDLQQTFCFL